MCVFNTSQITEGEKQSSEGDESQMGLHCLKKHVLSINFCGKRKEEFKNF